MMFATMKLIFTLVFAFSALTFSAHAQTKPAPKGAFDKPTLEAYARYLELFQIPVDVKIDDPKPSKALPGFSEVLVHFTYDGGAKDDLFYVSADGQTIVKGDVSNINRSPFENNLENITLAGQPTFGPANAPITIVEFGDLECPSCKAEAPVLRQDIPKAYPDKVRVVFKDFPLESIHPWARAAAIAARCILRQSQPAYWKFFDWDYDNQEQLDGSNLRAKVLEWAAKNSVDGAALGRCIDTKATEPEVNRNIAEARRLGLSGTPSLFINGRKVGGVPLPVLEQLIDIELKHQAGK